MNVTHACVFRTKCIKFFFLHRSSVTERTSVSLSMHGARRSAAGTNGFVNAERSVTWTRFDGSSAECDISCARDRHLYTSPRVRRRPVGISRCPGWFDGARRLARQSQGRFLKSIDRNALNHWQEVRACCGTVRCQLRVDIPQCLRRGLANTRLITSDSTMTRLYPAIRKSSSAARTDVSSASDPCCPASV